MKNSTVTVVCSFAALLYLFIGTIPALMWMDKTSAKHAWFWTPTTPSETWASGLIFCEVMAASFLPLLVFFTLAFTAWRDHNREQPPTINFNNDAGSGNGPKRPPTPPSFRPTPPARRPGPPPPLHRMTSVHA